MKQKKTVLLLLTLIGFLIGSVIVGYSQDNEYDVVVYGGGSAGFVAAIQAAKLGKSVALVEPSKHIGGINVEGLGGTDIDNHREFQNSPAVGGLALEFYRRIAGEYGILDSFDQSFRQQEKKPQLWRFEPHVAEKVIGNWVNELPITVILEAPLLEGVKQVDMEDATIRSINTEKGVIKGKVFIDATIEGDLLAAAGVSTVIGRESNAVYGETRNGIREHTTHCQFAVKVDPYREPGRPESGTIQGVFDEPLGTPGAGDHRLQAYCFRVCLTDSPENRLPLPKPQNYDRSHYELFLRYLKAGGRIYQPRANLPNRKTDFNGGSDVSHNLNGMNYGYPGGDQKQREQILKYHRDFTQGLFYFLANDPEVGQLNPELQQAWSTWGLPKDEFQDNGGWPRMFYVRDARRMVSDYVITEHHADKMDPKPVTDPVAVAFWPPDVHNVRTIVKDGYAYNEGFVFGGEWWQPFGISYRALVPKRSECTNLITPTCPSTSHIAYGAIRIEFTFMALGQAAATAAALAVDRRCAVQDVPYDQLEQSLQKQAQVLRLAK